MMLYEQASLLATFDSNLKKGLLCKMNNFIQSCFSLNHSGLLIELKILETLESIEEEEGRKKKRAKNHRTHILCGQITQWATLPPINLYYIALICIICLYSVLYGFNPHYFYLICIV
jgi:hypothetical protein